MSRDWQIALGPLEPETLDEVRSALLYQDELDVAVEADLVYCFVDRPHSPRRVRKHLLHYLAQFDLAAAVGRPRVERWDPAREEYVPVDGDASPDGAPPEPVLRPDEIAWLVDVEATSPLDWRPLREELARRGRPVIEETTTAFCVGARDEDDAASFVGEIEELGSVRRASARRLSRFHRWRLREQLQGNYASDSPGAYGF